MAGDARCHSAGGGAGWFFPGLLQQFGAQVANVGGIMNSAQQSLAAAGRVFEILDAPLTVRNAPAASPQLPWSGARSALRT